jgi:hypothetical protein
VRSCSGGMKHGQVLPKGFTINLLLMLNRADAPSEGDYCAHCAAAVSDLCFRFLNHFECSLCVTTVATRNNALQSILPAFVTLSETSHSEEWSRKSVLRPLPGAIFRRTTPPRDFPVRRTFRLFVTNISS